MNYRTDAIAQMVATQMEESLGGEYKVHNLEDKSFELSLNGVDFDGGSFYINEDDHLILASVTPQENWGDVKEFDEVLNKIKNLRN